MNDDPDDSKTSNSPFGSCELEATVRHEAARLLGGARSPVKAEAARTNGRKGGRPRGQHNNQATRERMKESQRQRRRNEKENLSASPSLAETGSSSTSTSDPSETSS